MPRAEGPVAVGGLGGSGTRVVAHILREAGMNMGPHLNGALDNLLFSRLFKNPYWHSRATDEEIRDRLRLFTRCTGGEPAVLSDVIAYTAAVMRNRTPGLGKTNGIGRLLLLRLKGGHRQVRWGWKELNTHIYLSHLAKSFPEIRYIHVLRNPLDIALSRNRQQLVNWGHLYGIDAREVTGRTQMGQFSYSIAANIRALETGARLLGRRFHVARFEAMCDSPGGEISRLLEFVGMPGQRGSDRPRGQGRPSACLDRQVPPSGCQLAHRGSSRAGPSARVRHRALA